MLAGGIHKALPADSPVRPQVESLAQSAATATLQMRSLLLQLRPVALDDAGLAGALDQLARAYRSRLGIAVSTNLDDVALTAEQEHALLRIAQEALDKRGPARLADRGDHLADGQQSEHPRRRQRIRSPRTHRRHGPRADARTDQ